MNEDVWYSAQCIFLHADKEHGPKQMYEERIVLLRAKSWEAAIEQAEQEAKKYCEDLIGTRYLGYVNIFELFDDVEDGAEIFSSMQKSDLSPEEYLDLHYPPLSDDCEAIGETHRWHNLDDKHSACYHCKVIRVAPGDRVEQVKTAPNGAEYDNSANGAEYDSQGQARSASPLVKPNKQREPRPEGPK